MSDRFMCSLHEAKKLILTSLKAKLVPYVQSSPGIGKSAIARQIAQECNLEFIDVRLAQMEPTDLLGFPVTDGNRSNYAPMDLFPLADTPLPAGKKGWLVLFDELSSATTAVQAAAYRIILDREVGKYPLHSNVALMAAGNLSTDRAIVNRMSTALLSRLVHIFVEPKLEDFLQWGETVGLDKRIVGYLEFMPDSLHRFNPQSDRTYPCSRTWHMMHKALQVMDVEDSSNLRLMAGIIGEGEARQFWAYLQVCADLPKIEQIIADPLGTKITDTPSVKHALANMCAEYITPKNATQLMQFLGRLSVDLQVVALRKAIKRDPAIKQNPEVQTWIRTKAKEL